MVLVAIRVQAYPGLLITLIGLVIAGPWLTSVTSRLFGRLSGGSSALLATRRLADNPKTAFRSVTGLVLAVFLGTMVGAIVPAVNATEASPANAALSNVLVDLVGLDSHAGAKLLSGLHGIAGATAYPLYSPQTGGAGRPANEPVDELVGAGAAVTCPVMRALAVLGQCAPGLAAVQASDGSLFVDNPIDKRIKSSLTAPGDGTTCGLKPGWAAAAFCRNRRNSWRQCRRVASPGWTSPAWAIVAL